MKNEFKLVVITVLINLNYIQKMAYHFLLHRLLLHYSRL